MAFIHAIYACAPDDRFPTEPNTVEGMWTGLRSFLRPFRGVSKWHLAGYGAMFD